MYFAKFSDIDLGLDLLQGHRGVDLLQGHRGVDYEKRQ